MNWKEAIASINKSTRNVGANINDFVDFFDIDNLDYSEEFYRRVRKYYIPGVSWICTDTEVGLAVYFFDEEPIAVSSQHCRKCHEYIYFLSKEGFDRLRLFMLSLLPKRETPLIDLNEEIHPSGEYIK